MHLENCEHLVNKSLHLGVIFLLVSSALVQCPWQWLLIIIAEYSMYHVLYYNIVNTVLYQLVTYLCFLVLMTLDLQEAKVILINSFIGLLHLNLSFMAFVPCILTLKLSSVLVQVGKLIKKSRYACQKCFQNITYSHHGNYLVKIQ